MPQTLTPKAVPPAREQRLVCDVCGAAADILLVADAVDRETGYQEQVQFCKACFKQRGRREEHLINRLHPFTGRSSWHT